LDDAAAAKVPTQEQYFRLHVSLRREMFLQEYAKRCTFWLMAFAFSPEHSVLGGWQRERGGARREKQQAINMENGVNLVGQGKRAS